MPAPYDEISRLSVALPLAAAAIAALLWRLRRRAALTWPRVLVVVTFCVYATAVLAATLLPVPLGEPDYHVAWQWFVNLTPLVHAEWHDVLQNVVLFVPLGVLLPLVARVGSVGRVLLAGVLASLTIELLQFVADVVFHAGHAVDVNDLLANVLGAPLGYGLLRVALRLRALARLADAATWPVRTPREAGSHQVGEPSPGA
ncbi:VanZ family protein [Cryptosporangium arvum]|uniref:Glycopeptide antibiotics resistance protein n=1 Tax=Cryptosporangium arvum DSM 44712 TaxID=927661 RepID=A0A010ZUZ2_9ACTN|nr:VanZ family protein [Cryptosporangium arvum]EXG82514.1 glycopeptide antibiotics resistance protein [Cryptosporangium arvum DSM 44712]